MNTRLALVLAAAAGLTSPVLAQIVEPTPIGPARVVPAQPTTEPATPTTAKPAKRKDIYDVKADAQAQIDAALAKAKKENRRVLVQWGANWCGWCHLLHGTFENDPQVKRKLSYEYDVVLIDVGQFDKHMDVAAAYGADLKGNGLPFLTVIGADGKAVANQETSSLESKKTEGGPEVAQGHDAKKVLEFLTANQAAPASAESVLGAGMVEAQESGKKVFLHFGAPWCGWCHKLEAWMVRPEVAPLLAKDYIDVKIDVDRMTGGKELSERVGATGGIPWFAVLDPTGGKKLITSDAKDGNVGFPYQPQEVEHFAKVLESTAKHMTKADREALVKSLHENRERETAKRGGS